MKGTILKELNAKYEFFPVFVREYEIDNKKYVVHAHFVGSKNIDDVILSIAFRLAMNETLHDPFLAA